MDIQSEKLEIIKMLIATDDSIIIAAVKMFLKLVKKAVWNEPEQQEEIDFQILEENHGDQLEV
jgi:sensor domain CHASE-containing protein